MRSNKTLLWSTILFIGLGIVAGPAVALNCAAAGRCTPGPFNAANHAPSHDDCAFPDQALGLHSRFGGKLKDDISLSIDQSHKALWHTGTLPSLLCLPVEPTGRTRIQQLSRAYSFGGCPIYLSKKALLC